jgi:hypothetical protein
MVVLVAFVAAVVCSVTVLFVRRGRQEGSSLEDSSGYRPASTVENVPPYGSRSPVQETSPYRYRSSLEDFSPYERRSSAQETSPYYPRRYVPSAGSTMSPTVGQAAARSQARQPYTKICKHCKNVVRDDANICPYCYKRLR